MTTTGIVAPMPILAPFDRAPEAVIAGGGGAFAEEETEMIEAVVEGAFAEEETEMIEAVVEGAFAEEETEMIEAVVEGAFAEEETEMIEAVVEGASVVVGKKEVAELRVDALSGADDDTITGAGVTGVGLTKLTELSRSLS
jgi:hypothetical protein